MVGASNLFIVLVTVNSCCKLFCSLISRICVKIDDVGDKILMTMNNDDDHYLIIFTRKSCNWYGKRVDYGKISFIKDR